MKFEGWLEWPDKRRLGMMLVILVGVIVFFIGMDPLRNDNEMNSGPIPTGPTNHLIVGEKGALQSDLNIAINAPAELDGLTRQQVLDMRRKAVEQHSRLLKDSYVPNARVFGQIEDGKPWWGLAGRFYFGRGDRSIDGLSGVSVGLLNPFLLVEADIWHKGNLQWNKKIVTPEFALSDNISYLPNIASLTYRADKAQAVVVYELSKFIESQKPLLDPHTPYRSSRVDLIAYNAVDFGYGYLHVCLEESKNVEQARKWTSPAAIPHFIHTGGSCGFEGGCNNVSPRFPPAEDIATIRFPAIIAVKLWHTMPESINTAPDFMFFIEII